MVDPSSALVRAGDEDALTALYTTTVALGRGRTVFVAGDDPAGRSALLRSWAAGLKELRPSPVILGGAFEDGAYVPWEQDRAAASGALSRLERAMAAGEAVVSLSELVLPAQVARLLGQVVSKSDAAFKLGSRALARPDPAGIATLVPRALARLCEDSPVVCIVDAPAGNAGGLWADLAGLFARRIARDLPLLLVLAIDGPRELGPHDDDEPDALNIARQLTADDVDVATWHWLAPLAAMGLERLTGPAAPDVLHWLCEASDGRGEAAAELWDEWRRRGVVEDLTDARWRFAAGRERDLGSAEDAFDERLKRLTGGDLNAIGRAGRMLGCAALEGRCFTAPAVAAALGHDADATIDELDEVLTRDGEHPDGFVVDDGFMTVHDEQGTRHLAMYRFGRDLDWRIARRYGLSEAGRGQTGARLADALDELYGGQANRVAHTLARLYDASGETERARHYRRMSDIGTDRAIVLWRARNVLAAEDPADRAERRRAVQLLIAASRLAFNSGSFHDGLAFAEAACRLAERRADEAEALLSAATNLVQLGEYERARANLARALHLCRELADRFGEARVLYVLGESDRFQGRFGSARRRLTTVLAIDRELGHREGEAATLYVLGEIDRVLGRFEEARSRLQAALAIERSLGNRRGEAITRHKLAELDFAEGRPERARADLSAVLALFRELGERHGEAVTRHTLADIDRARGHHERARTELLAVLALRHDIGDRRGEALVHQALGEIDQEHGEYDRAREELIAALGLFEELGNRHGEAGARLVLAKVEHLAGHVDRARSEVTTALELFGELGDHDGETACATLIAEIGEA